MKTTEAACSTHFPLYTIQAKRRSFTFCFGFVNCILIQADLRLSLFFFSHLRKSLVHNFQIFLHKA